MSRCRSIPVDADSAFEIVADLANMGWLPPGVEPELSGSRLLRLRFRDRDIEMPIMIGWGRLCVEWGASGGADYSGRLRVLRLGDKRERGVGAHARGAWCAQNTYRRLDP